MDVNDEQSFDIPSDSKILCVQVQHGVPCIWVLVDPNVSKERKKIMIYGTGHPITEDGQYIGTFQVLGGSLVFHVFEGVQ